MLNFNIDPVLLTLGPFEIRYYGLVYVLGFIIAYVWLRYMVKHKKINLDNDELDTLIIYLMLGVIIGSRLFHIMFWEPSYYLAHPLQMLEIWKGGMAFHGGLIGVIVATWLFSRKPSIKEKGITFAKIADIMVIPAVFALALGRIANFLNGELVGTKSSLPWCFNFPGYEGYRHPVQLYGALKRFIVMGILIFLNNVYVTKGRFKDGFLFTVFIGLMGIGRFMVDFFREDPRWFGLSEGQYLGLAMFIGAVVVYVLYYFEHQNVRNI